MFLNPQTNDDLRIPSSRVEESDTALRLWLALQVSPSRSPRACSQKIAFFCSRACSFASSRDDSQLTSLVNSATFFSTLAPGTRVLLESAGCAFFAFFFCADAGWHQTAATAIMPIASHLRMAGHSLVRSGERGQIVMRRGPGYLGPL